VKEIWKKWFTVLGHEVSNIKIIPGNRLRYVFQLIFMDNKVTLFNSKYNTI